MKIVRLTAGIDLAAFTCGAEPYHGDLDEFLQLEALRYAAVGLGHTYLAMESAAVIGYVTHLTDSIQLDLGERRPR